MFVSYRLDASRRKEQMLKSAFLISGERWGNKPQMIILFFFVFFFVKKKKQQPWIMHLIYSELLS